jgi:hypothetical protein
MSIYNATLRRERGAFHCPYFPHNYLGGRVFVSSRCWLVFDVAMRGHCANEHIILHDVYAICS